MNEAVSQEQMVHEVRAGRRIHTTYSLHREAKPEGCNTHRYRVIACDEGVADVIECSACGDQRLGYCSADEDCR